MNQTIILHTPAHRQRAKQLIDSLPDAPVYEMTLKEHKTQRSIEQNRKLWGMLRDVSEQVNWYGNKLSSEEWKDVFTASLKRQKVVPGLDSGFVVLGTSTSKMSVSEMSELIECITAFGCQQRVRWSDPKWQEV